MRKEVCLLSDFFTKSYFHWGFQDFLRLQVVEIFRDFRVFARFCKILKS